MEDKEIIKALECCAVAFDCPDCPFECDCGSMQNLSTAAIDLINRLKADKEALIAGQESLMKCIAKKKGTIAELDAEVERLQKENNLYSDLAKMGDALKSEAIKEFAERLKKEATVDEDSTWWIANIDVDNLVKELTGPKAETSVSLIDGHIDGKEFWNDTH